MTQSVLILGRQPALGLAEAESLFGAAALTPLGTQAVVVDVPFEDIPFNRMGGSTRVAKLLTYLPYTDWQKIEVYLAQELPKHTCCLPEGKIRLGLSVYGLQVNVRKLNATGLSLKKVVKNPPTGDGRSVRVVPNNAIELNTAQVIHNQLTGATGMELLLIRDGDRTALAQTMAVQDIAAYAARDQARPARDAKVGMLPPKLAQMIVNLSRGKIIRSDIPSTDVIGGWTARILDPFCGTGVVLQEAQLMNYDIYGTDIEPRMIEYTQKNLDWLSQSLDLSALNFQLNVGDATNHTWTQPVSFIACETYLGRPFASEPKPETLREVMQDVDTIHRKFLKNVVRQTEPGFRMCIAVPAWKTSTPAHRTARIQAGSLRPGSGPDSLDVPTGMPHSSQPAQAQRPSTLKYARYDAQESDGFKHLPVLDNLQELGYTRMSFVHTDTRDLLYHRENQVVARELVILIRK